MAFFPPVLRLLSVVMYSLGLVPPRDLPAETMSTNASQEIDIDNIIERLLAVRNARPGKLVQLEEREIRALCMKSREIFITQPVLLELAAPIKICGTLPLLPLASTNSTR